MKYTSALAIFALVSNTSAISLAKEAECHPGSTHHIEKAAHAAATKAINKFLEKWNDQQEAIEAKDETKKAVGEVKKEAEKAEKRKELKEEEEKVVKAVEKLEEKAEEKDAKDKTK